MTVFFFFIKKFRSRGVYFKPHLRLTITRASGMAKMLPLLFIASHVYAPASVYLTSVMVRVPLPPWLSTRTRFPVGMLPQLSRHTMRGVGTPTASQKIENWPPSSTSNSFTGGTVITGAAREEEVKDFCNVLTLMVKNLMFLNFNTYAIKCS